MRALLAILALLVLALPVRAHGAGLPWIHVPADFVMPGEEFTVIAADLGPQVQVTLQVVRGEDLVPIGTAQADPLGHFEATLELPTDFPHGYVELVALGTDGSEATTWILVGPPTETTAAPAVQPATRPDALSDPSVLLLGAGLLGGAAALGLAVLRRGRTPPRRAMTAGPIARPVPARPVPARSRKGRRRAG